MARDRASTVRSYAYDDLFFHYIQQGATRSAQHIAPLVIDALGARSVLDVGCGAGAWLDVYSKLGVETCLGVDGDYVKPEMLLIPPKDFIASDISRPFDVERRFDLVRCLEVGEHLPTSASRTLVENLVRHGDCVLFSAATPGQGGENHINEQPYEFWRQLFAEHGYAPYDFLRPQIAGVKQIEIWYRHNAVLYVSQRAQASLASDVAATRVPDGVPIPHRSSVAYRVRARILSTLPVTWLSRMAIWKHRGILLVRAVTNSSGN